MTLRKGDRLRFRGNFLFAPNNGTVVDVYTDPATGSPGVERDARCVRILWDVPFDPYHPARAGRTFDCTEQGAERMFEKLDEERSACG